MIILKRTDPRKLPEFIRQKSLILNQIKNKITFNPVPKTITS